VAAIIYEPLVGHDLPLASRTILWSCWFRAPSLCGLGQGMPKTIVLALLINAPRGLLWRFGVKLLGDSTFVNGIKPAYRRCRSAAVRVFLDESRETHLLLHLRESRTRRSGSARTDRVMVAKTCPNLTSPDFVLQEGQEYVMTLYHSAPPEPMLSAMLVSLDTKLPISHHPMGFSVPITVREPRQMSQLLLGISDSVCSPIARIPHAEADFEFDTYETYYEHLKFQNPDVPPLYTSSPSLATHEQELGRGEEFPPELPDIPELQSAQIMDWLMQTFLSFRQQSMAVCYNFQKREAEYKTQIQNLTDEVRFWQERYALDRHPVQAVQDMDELKSGRPSPSLDHELFLEES